MIRGWFVDTSVLLLAAGGEHAQRPPCRAFLTAAAASQTPLHASTEAIQEYLFHGLRVSDRESAIAQSRALVGVLHLHDLTGAVQGASWRPFGKDGRLFARQASASSVACLVAASEALWSYDKATPQQTHRRIRSSVRLLEQGAA